MERKDFLKLTGAAGVVALFPGAGHAEDDHDHPMPEEAPGGGSCVLIPTETAGPYPLDLSGNSSYYRQDITDGYEGTPLRVRLTIVNVNADCAPLANLRVDVWHCNKDGYYSGFVNQGYLGSQNNTSLRFFRGIQLTDADGVVEFETIYPGWYSGRVTHIHFQVFLSSAVSVVSQMCFPEDVTAEVQSGALYSGHGVDPLTNATDPGIFATPSGAYVNQRLEVSADGAGGYLGTLTVGVSAPSTGVSAYREPLTGGQFVLGQNQPNPMVRTTTIPLTLQSTSDVVLAMYDHAGKRCAMIQHAGLAAGDHLLAIDLDKLGLASGNYVYEVTVTNGNGQFRQAKMMTAGR